jgi:osmoprotectant transport system ATP-binding protein
LNAKSAIEFAGVTKSYDGNDVIKDLSLVIPAATTTAIVGESGSGKSTLMQLVNGLVMPDTGVVTVNGHALDYESLPSVRRTMGYAVQGAGLFPHLTIKQNVTLVSSLAGWGSQKIDARYTQLLDIFGLSDELSARFPHSLSGGQQQRVGLCRAMMLDPPLLLLDEPFSALDPITRESIYEEFTQLQENGVRSIFLVTHDMHEAVRLAQRLVILKEGEVVQQGSPAEIEANPADDYVNRLFVTRIKS